MDLKKLFICVLAFSTVAACQSKIEKAVRDTKYSLYEYVGVEKRDLFKREVENTRENQEDTNEAFEDALERLQKLYGSTGSKVESEYKSLKSSYEDADKRANEVYTSVKKMNTVANDLFEEWRKEANELGSAEMRSKSLNSLSETQKKYREFYSQLKKSESKIAPVLKTLKDQVTYLKHNLNAKAIAGLKTESDRIQGDIKSLMIDMNSSIQQSNEFIKTLE